MRSEASTGSAYNKRRDSVSMVISRPAFFAARYQPIVENQQAPPVLCRHVPPVSDQRRKRNDDIFNRLRVNMPVLVFKSIGWLRRV